MNVRVSVVVPTARRDELLARCLDALLAQDFDPHEFEIIVADDAACDSTKQVVCCKAGQRANPVIRYLPVTGNHGPAAARNVGWRAASGKIIAFTDDDCVPAPSWLHEGVAAFTDGVVGVTGRIEIPLNGTPTDYERDAAGLGNTRFATANCLYLRDALVAVGGFDERFTQPWREDSDLFFTMLTHGGALVDAPEAVVVHPVRPAQWGVSIKQQRKSSMNALLYKKHPALYRHYVKPIAPWSYYAIIAALLTLFIALVKGRIAATIVAASVWGWLTGRFCAQRLKNTAHTPTHIAEMAITSAVIPPLAVFWRLVGAVRFRVPFL